ncbi:hypothetical protein D9M69_651500 [compost metagenome]
MPYILISNGCRSSKASYHGRRLATSSASPPNTTYRRDMSGALAQANGINWRKAEGVWLSTVTPSSLSKRAKSSGERLTAWGTTTSLPP